MSQMQSLTAGSKETSLRYAYSRRTQRRSHDIPSALRLCRSTTRACRSSQTTVIGTRFLASISALIRHPPGTDA